MKRSEDDSTVAFDQAGPVLKAGFGRLPLALRVAFWMTAAALGYACMLAVVKHLSAGMNIYVVIFWRYLLALLIFVPWAIRARGSRLKTGRLGLHIVRSVLMVIHGGALMVAVLAIPLAEATSLIFTIPLFATVLAAILLREAVGLRSWAVLAVGFAGVLVILRPGMQAFDPAAGLVLVSAITGAGVVVIGKYLLRSDSVELTVFLLMLFSVPCALIPAVVFWQWPTLEQVPWLIALGLIANVYMYGMTRALNIAETAQVMALDFLRMPFSALTGFLFFAEVIDPWAWLGAAIIFGSTIYNTHREMRAGR